MKTDNFGFPVADPGSLAPEARALRAEYQARDPAYFEARARELARKGLHATASPAPPPEGVDRVAVFSGGGSGSGKTSVAEAYLASVGIDPDTVLVVDPDRYKEVIPEYQRLRDLGDPEAASLVHDESKALSLLGFELALASGMHVFYDSTLSSYEASVTLLKRAAGAGLRTVIVGVATAPEAALRRVLDRGEVTGRLVPPASVLWTHKHFALAFEHYLEYAASWQLYQNNGQPGEIRRITSGAYTEMLSLDDPAALDEFRSYGSIREAATDYQSIRA